jgi:hypothetical protein
MLELATKLDGLLGGFLSVEEREDIVFFCDTLIVPGTTDRNTFIDLGADEIDMLEDGRLRIWWD